MISKLIKSIKRWHCRYKFNSLSDQDKRLFKAMEIDPDSLIRKGEL